MMAWIFLPVPLAAWLVTAAAPAAELPGGGAGFHARMLSWAPPAADPAPASHPVTAVAVALPRLSSRFGRRIDPFRGAPGMHFGIDIPGPSGTRIAASAAGAVRFAGSAHGYGEMVEIDHGGGLSTRYAHLSALLVRPGDRVAAGTAIARMGASGRATGSHLHFEVRRDGRPVDPIGYLAGARDTAPGFAVAAAEAPHVSQFARARDAAARARDLDR